MFQEVQDGKGSKFAIIDTWLQPHMYDLLSQNHCFGWSQGRHRTICQIKSDLSARIIQVNSTKALNVVS